jgi:hypothetical protein
MSCYQVRDDKRSGEQAGQEGAFGDGRGLARELLYAMAANGWTERRRGTGASRCVKVMRAYAVSGLALVLN